MRGTPPPAGQEYSEGLANRWRRASGCGEAAAEALGKSAGSAGEKRGLDTSMDGSWGARLGRVTDFDVDSREGENQVGP